jgi:AraC family transcriptional regulator
MRSSTAVTFVQYADWQAAGAPPPHRLLAAAAFIEALAGRTEARAAAVCGPAWQDLRVASFEFGGSGEGLLPRAAFYFLLSSARSMVIGNPGDAISMRWAQTDRATLLCIEPRVLYAAAEACGSGAAHPKLRAEPAPPDAVCERLVGALVEEAKAGEYPRQELIVASVANALALRLVTRFADAAHPGGLRGALNPHAFREVSAYIERHLAERLSLDELARVAGVSRFHFARQFRLRTSESPMEFLMRTRIERGKTLLRAGVASVGDVASALGFADQSHFARTFKRHVGVPPSVYKSRARLARTLVQACRTSLQVRGSLRT